jgi:nicotinamide-nucleotide amidase
MALSLLPDDIAALARRVVEDNAGLGRKVATAESCTGGLVAGAITEIAGSSAVLERGFVTYSNEAKMEMLGVSRDIIETFGAVSIACAWAMAKGALDRSKADIAVAISGIAGPGGATATKPVGIVYIGVARKGTDAFVVENNFSGDRSSVRQQSLEMALNLLLKALTAT